MATRIPQDLIDLLNQARITSSNGLPMQVKLGDLLEAAMELRPGDLQVVSVVGEATTVGGAPAEVILDAAVQAGDLVHWSILDGGLGDVKGVSAVAGAGDITFTFSADPTNDTVISYAVARAIP